MNHYHTKGTVQGLLYKSTNEAQFPPAVMAATQGYGEVKVTVHGQDTVVNVSDPAPREMPNTGGYVNNGLETEEEDILWPDKIELEEINIKG